MALWQNTADIYKRKTNSVFSCAQLSFNDSMLQMQTITEIGLQRAKRGVFTRRQAACWVDSSGARLDALLKRAVNAQEIWRIHRGLYCLSNRHTQHPINPFELAQRIHGPSYISLETTLSYHGWIPEAVHAITSTSLERSRTFSTPLGLFSFTRDPQLYFFTGVSRAQLVFKHPRHFFQPWNLSNQLAPDLGVILIHLLFFNFLFD